MNKHLKFLSVLILLLSLSFTVFAVSHGQSSNSVNGKEAANNSTSTSPGDTPGTWGQSSNSGWRGPDAWTYRMSLEELDNWDFTGYTGDEYAAKIQEYGEHYYVACQEEAYYGANKTTEPTKTARGKKVIYQNATDYPVLNHVMNDLLAGQDQVINDAYVCTDSSDGHRYINPDPNVLKTIVDEFAKLGSHNAALAQKYLAAQSDPNAAAHPVVICIEVVGNYYDGGTSWASAADMCHILQNGEAAYRTFLNTDMKGTVDSLASQSARYPESATEKTIVDITGYRNKYKDEWPARWIKRFFHNRYTNGQVTSLNDGGVSTWGWNAWQSATQKRTGINGCTMVTLGNGIGIPPTDLSDHPDGKYTWHIDAEGATLTSSGHKEDQVVQLGGSTSGAISKTNIVGALNINQDNTYEWENWITAIDAKSVKLEVKKYHLGQSCFTTDRSTILSSGAEATGTGITSTSVGNTQTISLTLSEFKDALTNPDKTFDISTDVLGNI